MVVHLEDEWLRDLKCRGTRGQALKHDGDICGVVHGGSFQKRSEKPLFFFFKVQDGWAAEEGRKGTGQMGQAKYRQRIEDHLLKERKIREVKDTNKKYAVISTVYTY